MVRVSVSGRRGDQFELKTLKVSKDTLDSIRKPNIWTRPSSGLYDYHYEIGGLYYQPMINYCIEREKGGARRNVDMPDRIMSNFDKRAFVLSDDCLDYEDFLAQMYRKRIRVDNTKTIDCSMKLYSGSKENSRLNDYRDSAQQRDKYVCQLQLHHTGQVAKKENLLKEKSAFSEEEAAFMASKARQSSEERERKMLVLGINKDDRYGPGFKKVGALNSHNKHWDPLEEFYKQPQEVKEEENVAHSSSSIQQESSSKMTRVVINSDGEVIESSETRKGGFQPIVKKELLEAETLSDWVKERVASGPKKVEKVIKPLYLDTGYAKALDEVQERVRKAGMLGEERMTTKSFNHFLKNRKIEDIGKHSKVAIYTAMMTTDKCPDFDVGYDTINSIKEARVIR